MRAALVCLMLLPLPLAAQDDGEPFLALDDDVIEALDLEPEADNGRQFVTDNIKTDTSSGPSVSSLLAECAAMLAVASSTSSSFVERDRLRDGAAMWFATAGDAALEQGLTPDSAAWAAAVERWTAQIHSVDALAAYPEWSRSCVELGNARALDTAVFAAALGPDTGDAGSAEESAETDEPEAAEETSGDG